ncbi:MAG: hypothetical protein ACYDBI_05880 [Thermoplasmataceae archaeon]
MIEEGKKLARKIQKFLSRRENYWSKDIFIILYRIRTKGKYFISSPVKRSVDRDTE